MQNSRIRSIKMNQILHFRLWGIECELLTPSQCKEKCNILETSDLLGGIFIPKDGVAHPKYICDTLMSEANRMGVTIIEKCTVREVEQWENEVSSVSTNRGRIKCKYFVNCAGFWARSIGEMSEPIVKIPLQAAEHYFLHTKPIEHLDPMMPVIRDLDGQIYIRESEGRILAGGFNLNAKSAYENSTIPCKFCLLSHPFTFQFTYVFIFCINKQWTQINVSYKMTGITFIHCCKKS